MQGGNQVGTIIYRKLGFMVQSSIDVPVVSCFILSLNRINRNVILYQGSGDIVLSAEGVGSTYNDIGSPLFQG